MGSRGSESSLRSPAGNGRPCINPPPPNSARSPKEGLGSPAPGDRGETGHPCETSLVGEGGTAVRAAWAGWAQRSQGPCVPSLLDVGAQLESRAGCCRPRCDIPRLAAFRVLSVGQALRRGFSTDPSDPKVPDEHFKGDSVPETQCSPHGVRGPESPENPWPGGADRHGTSKTSGFMQGVGRPQSARGPASFGGQAKRSECQMASPGNRRVGGEDATPSPQTTGHQLQGNRQREAGSPDSRAG